LPEPSPTSAKLVAPARIGPRVDRSRRRGHALENSWRKAAFRGTEALRSVVVWLERRVIGGRAGSASVIGFALAACTLASPASAKPTFHLECPPLSADDAAQVEARLLASLAMRDAVDLNVTIACDGGSAVVSVGGPDRAPSVVLSGAATREEILALAERAVAQVLSNDAATNGVVPSPPEAAASAALPEASVASVASAERAPPKQAAVARVAVVPTRAAPECVTPADHASRVSADIALESWGSHPALGIALGLEQTAGRWAYAFLAGGARSLSDPAPAQVTEWTAAGELSWQSEHAAGIRVSTQLGLSLLVLDPESDVAASSGTTKAAGFMDFAVSRPIWLGRFGIAPGLGARAFSAKRLIRSEGAADLQLSTPSVRGLLTLLFRTSE